MIADGSRVKRRKAYEKTNQQGVTPMNAQDTENYVNSIARDLTHGMTYEEADMDHEEHGYEPNDQISAFDYLSDVLDIEYTISSHGVFLGARILVAWGGPNIWIDTRHEKVEGYWWGDTVFSDFTDKMDLHGACRELYEMRA
jgi:hypothetical protein